MTAGLFLAAGCLYAQNVLPDTNFSAREEQIIAAAKSEAAPRFNGAPVVGIRPGTPFIYSLAVTGARPIAFSAKKLPAGLVLDSKTGIISGSLAEAGEFLVKVTARNAAGQAKTEIKTAQRLTNGPAGVEIWAKKLADRSLAVGIFNRGNAAVSVNLFWHDLGLRTRPAVRDLWLRKNLGRQKNFTAELPPHGCVLLRVM